MICSGVTRHTGGGATRDHCFLVLEAAFDVGLQTLLFFLCAVLSIMAWSRCTTNDTDSFLAKREGSGTAHWVSVP